MKLKKYICPACKAKEGVDIIYGNPSTKLFELAARNEVALGGCVIEDRQPDRHCLACEHDWQIKRRNSLPNAV